MKNSKKILVAKIGAAHSIKGEVRLISYCSPTEQIINYNPLFNSNCEEFNIEKIRPQKNILICKFKNINDRTEAEKLNGIELFTHRDNFPQLKEEEFYIQDLIGLYVVNENNQHIGTVLYVHNYGAGDILEILFKSSNKTEFLPFRKELFPDIDLEKGTILYIYHPS